MSVSISSNKYSNFKLEYFIKLSFKSTNEIDNSFQWIDDLNKNRLLSRVPLFTGGVFTALHYEGIQGFKNVILSACQEITNIRPRKSFYYLLHA